MLDDCNYDKADAVKDRALPAPTGSRDVAGSVANSETTSAKLANSWKMVLSNPNLMHSELHHSNSSAMTCHDVTERGNSFGLMAGSVIVSSGLISDILINRVSSGSTFHRKTDSLPIAMATNAACCS